MAKKYAAIGTQWWISDGGSPEAFFKVANCGDIGGPKVKVDTIDTTTQDTEEDEGGYKEFISSLKDGQELTVVVFLDPNDSTLNEAPTVAGVNAGGLKYLAESREKRNMNLVYPVSPKVRVRFKGIVTGFEYDSKVTGALMANATVKVSGKPTMEAGDHQ